MRTFDEIIKEANNRGLNLNNLFQLRNTSGERITGWQANFHHASGWHDFGRGATAVEALEDALSRAKGLQGPENRPIPRDIPVKPVVEELLL